MATTSYKCLNCGAGLHFNPEFQKFKCEYCLSEFTEVELLLAEEQKINIEENHIEVEEEKIEQHLNSYTCNSCGATVVTDETTTATFCYYCHNPVIISNRLQGEFLPNKLIPFSINKDKAQDIFLKWAGDKKFVPKDFTSSSQLEKITGMYLPYWWVDSQAEVNVIGEGRNTKVWRSGDTEFTETKKYQIVREGLMDINNVGELAFNKIDKNLLDGISPYDESQTIPFTMPYLSGFFAEQYNIEKEEVEPLLKEQIDKYFDYLLKETISGYSQVSFIKNDIHIDLKQWNYTLLPVWILTYNYNHKTYVFAVNGQTGKSFGELPLSNKRVLTASGIIFGTLFIALLLGGFLIW